MGRPAKHVDHERIAGGLDEQQVRRGPLGRPPGTRRAAARRGRASLPLERRQLLVDRLADDRMEELERASSRSRSARASAVAKWLAAPARGRRPRRPRAARRRRRARDRTRRAAAPPRAAARAAARPRARAPAGRPRAARRARRASAARDRAPACRAGRQQERVPAGRDVAGGAELLVRVRAERAPDERGRGRLPTAPPAGSTTAAGSETNSVSRSSSVACSGGRVAATTSSGRPSSRRDR